MANEEVGCYIGRAKCGCVIAATVDDGKDPKRVAKDVAEFIADGLTVERSTVGYVRQNFGCKHKAAQLSLEQLAS